MNLIKSLFESVLLNIKILLLWNVRDHFTWRHFGKIIAIMLLNIITSFAKILAPAAMAKAVEMIALDEKDFEVGNFQLSPTHLLYFSVVMMTWIKSELYLKKLISRDFERLQIEKSTMQLIETIHKIPYCEHQRQKPYMTKSLIDIINCQSKLVPEVLTNIFSSYLDMAIGLTLIWRRYGNVLGGEFLTYLVLDIFLLSYFVDFVTHQNQKFQSRDKKLHRFMNHEYEIMNYEETVRTFHHETLEIKLSQYLLRKYLISNSAFLLSEDLASVLKIIPVIIANIIPVTFLLKEHLSLKDLDDFIFLVSYINLFGGSISALNQSMKNCLRAMRSIEKQKDFCAQHSNQHQAIQQPLLIGVEPDFDYPSPLIEFQNVVFGYPGCVAPILKGVTFTIRPGTKVGVIGRSNAGKSTIVKLLFGLYQNQAGEIKLNGHNIKDISKQVLAKIFCCIPQTAELFRERSLKYNVIYGSDNEEQIYNLATKKISGDQTTTLYKSINLDDNDIETGLYDQHEIDRDFKEAMHRVCLAPLLTSDANKPNSTECLSGGQRQRASVARALVRHSKIFIFDESSCALDSFTESEVLKSIKEVTHGKTSIMITHRLSTVRDVNEVIVIEEGRVVEQGSPAHLLEQRGTFYRYWEQQMNNHSVVPH